MSRLDQIARFWLPLGGAAVLLTVLGVGLLAEVPRYRLGRAPQQPIPFSHALHAGTNDIPCLYCHSDAERSRHAGVPSLSKCMNCHRVTRTESPHVRRVAAALESGEPIAWARIHSLPDHVYFDHRPHVAAPIDCRECHGRVDGMEVVQRVLNMRMGACLECHRGERTYFHGPVPVNEGPTNCWTCHR